MKQLLTKYQFFKKLPQISDIHKNRNCLRVFACNSGTQMRVRDSSATRIFFKKNRMMQHRAQKITTKF